MNDKTCNGGYCQYKILGGANPMCSYTGYCDYQCPKDSRNFGYSYTFNPLEDIATNEKEDK